MPLLRGWFPYHQGRNSFSGFRASRILLNKTRLRVSRSILRSGLLGSMFQAHTDDQTFIGQIPINRDQEAVILDFLVGSRNVILFMVLDGAGRSG